jgi:phosphoribosylformylglycinamidine synthase
VRAGTVASAHDVAEGGILVAVAECCLAGGIGAQLDEAGSEADLFGEGPGTFVVSGAEAALAALPGARLIGRVGGDALELAAERWSLAELREAHSALAPLFP